MHHGVTDRCFPFYTKKLYAKLQKYALLSLHGKSDMWSKVLGQGIGDLWAGANVTMMMMSKLEYVVPIQQTLPALFQIRSILRQRHNTLCLVGIRFIRHSSALLCSHYSR